MKVIAPARVLGQILSEAPGKENVASITAIQYPLRQIDSTTCHVLTLVHVHYGIDRTAVKSHSDLDRRLFFQRPADLHRTTDRRFRTGEEDQCHSVAGRQTNQFSLCLSAPNLLAIADNLVKLAG